MASVVGAIVVSVALSYLANRFLAPDPENPLTDDTPTTLSTRGSFLPVIMGRRRTGPVFCYAGGRRTEEESASGGGKDLGGSSGGTGGISYFEKGWHAICIGPVWKLVQVRAGSTNQINSQITSSGSPSGSGHGTGGKGHFRFYFGECSQPNDSSLVNKVGIASNWPNVCYAYWDERKLGQGPTWPNIDYEVEVKPVASALVLQDSNAWLNDGNSKGWNPAHAIYQLLTSAYPQGSGLDPSKLDLNRFEQLGVLLQNEHLPINIVGRSGMSLAKLLADIMQDIGVLMPQVGDLIVPWLIRDTIAPFDEVIPVWDSTILETPLQETVIKDISRPVQNRLLFQFPRDDNRYRKYDMVVDDDSDASVNSRIKTTKIDMPSVTHIDIASNEVDRRQVELLGEQRTLKGKFLRDARLISSGQRFDLSGVGRFRVLSNKRLTDDGACELEYILDPFGEAPSGFAPTSPVPVDQIPDRNSSIPAADDLAFDFFEPPCTMSQSVVPLIFGLRARDNEDILGANAWISTQDITYGNLGSSGKNNNTGTLNADFDITENVIVEVGPVITLDSVDALLFLDFSGDNDSWLTGGQLMIINDEWFFLQSVTALGGDQYQLNGVVRARQGTEQANHLATNRVWIFALIDVVFLTGNVVVGQNLYYKSVPFTATQEADITGIVPVQRVITGRTLQPLSVTALRTGNVLTDARGNVFVVAVDTVIDWNYRVCQGSGVAQGEQTAGTLLSTTDLPSDGEMTLEILDGADVVKRTETIAVDTATYTYTTANRTADFGGEPVLFKVRLTQHDSTGARSSDTVVITVLQET